MSAEGAVDYAAEAGVRCFRFFPRVLSVKN